MNPEQTQRHAYRNEAALGFNPNALPPTKPLAITKSPIFSALDQLELDTIRLHEAFDCLVGKLQPVLHHVPCQDKPKEELAGGCEIEKMLRSRSTSVNELFEKIEYITSVVQL